MYENQREALAYIAGILEGEGSIMIRRAMSLMQMKHRRYPNFHPCIMIGMLHREPLDFIVEKTGFGTVYQEKPYHHKRGMFRYKLTRQDEILKFINLMYEFLFIKKEHVEIVREFYVTCKNKAGVPLTEEINNRRTNLWLRIRTLNGVVEVPAETERRNKGGRSKGVRLEATVQSQ